MKRSSGAGFSGRARRVKKSAEAQVPVPIELTFTKEEAGWLITDMDIEGL